MIYSFIILNKNEFMRVTHYCYMNDITFEYRPNGKCMFFEDKETRTLVQRFTNRI